MDCVSATMRAHLAVGAMLMLTGCDHWNQVELKNARQVQVDVEVTVSKPETVAEFDCKTRERKKDVEAIAVAIPPGESVCMEGPLGAYHWAEVKDFSVTLKTSEGTCAKLDGAGFDAAANEDGKVVITDKTCGH